MISNLDVRVQAVINEVGGAKDGEIIHTETPLIVGMANPFSTVDVYDSATLLGVVVANGQGAWSLQLSTPLFDGLHDLSAVQAADYGGGRVVNYFSITTHAVDAPPIDDSYSPYASRPALSSRPYFPANVFHVRTPKMALDADSSAGQVPATSTAAATAAPVESPEHYARRAMDFCHSDRNVETVAFLGHHQVLDLGALTDKSLAIASGAAGFDLGGHHNSLKLSLADVLNLGEPNLFIDDGKKQMMVTGKEGDSVALSNSHGEGVSHGKWEHHGTTQVGGHTFNLIEHSGSHTELLVEQAVLIELH